MVKPYEVYKLINNDYERKYSIVVLLSSICEDF